MFKYIVFFALLAVALAAPHPKADPQLISYSGYTPLAYGAYSAYPSSYGAYAPAAVTYGSAYSYPSYGYYGLGYNYY